VELEFWRSVKESNKPEELNAYLSSYPNGQFKSLAWRGSRPRERPVDHHSATFPPVSTPPPSPRTPNQVTEDQIGLDKGQRRDVQRRLNGLGFDNKVSGKFEEETRTLIKRWQAARGFPARAISISSSTRRCFPRSSRPRPRAPR